MLKPVPHYGDVVTLVPLSGIQFLDFSLKFDDLGRQSRWFVERETKDSDDETRLSLIPLTEVAGEDGTRLQDLVSGAFFEDEEAYKVDGRSALEPFLGQWLPVPFFRIIGMDSRRQEVHERGPINWARVYIVKLATPEANGATHRLVLAFDTDTQDADRSEHQPYVMPTRLDAETEERFSFAASDPDLLWFLDADWIEDWLSNLYETHRENRGPRRSQASSGGRYTALARYIVLIQALAATVSFPQIRLIDTHSESLNYQPIPVDLIVDVGNSRTCGILIESHGERAGGGLSLSDPLVLRDLSCPEHTYQNAFESRIEFVRPMFGLDGQSRLSGRDRAFQWPSLVRIGPEAQRLSVGGSGTEGMTGMSSPKRYLWDDRPAGQIWRTRRPDRRDAGATEPVSGPLLQLVTETGELIGGKRARRRGRSTSQQPAIRPKFSRSSLFTFLMAEIVAQTITAMNSPERRAGKKYSDVPRFLRNIIMTLPPATPLAERRIMEDAVEDAIELVWRSLGWTGTPKRSHHVGRPSARINLDEATATQLVYLYSEIVEKYRDEPSGFFEIMGRRRPERGTSATLRIASIDIGGGTSDLIVITYRLSGRKVIEPEQDFREGFRIAGDDVVDAVVANHVLPAIELRLKEAGLSEPKAFLKGIVGADRGGMSEQERQFRRRFVVQLLEPAGLALLGQLEGRAMLAQSGSVEQQLAAAWTAARPEAETIAREFDAMAARAGARDFQLADSVISATAEEINATIRSVLARALEDFAEIITKLDCDVLLISGRPSRLPVVADMLVNTLCVRPDRVVPMHRYRAGRWYPFRDAQDRVSDPKTTVAVGAMLCYLAESQIEHFTVRTGRLTVKSTARFIGEMLPNDKIAARDVLFSDVDLDNRNERLEEATIRVESQTTTIGFRQLPLERWQASPLYTIDIDARLDQHPSPFPVSVTLRKREPLNDPSDDPVGAELAREDFEIAEFSDANGEQRRDLKAMLRLQTMKNASGYWLDTGVVSGY